MHGVPPGTRSAASSGVASPPLLLLHRPELALPGRPGRRALLLGPGVAMAQHRYVCVPARDRAERERGASTVTGGDVARPVGRDEADLLLARGAALPERRLGAHAVRVCGPAALLASLSWPPPRPGDRVRSEMRTSAIVGSRRRDAVTCKRHARETPGSPRAPGNERTDTPAAWYLPCSSEESTWHSNPRSSRATPGSRRRPPAARP